MKKEYFIFYFQWKWLWPIILLKSIQLVIKISDGHNWNFIGSTEAPNVEVTLLNEQFSKCGIEIGRRVDEKQKPSWKSRFFKIKISCQISWLKTLHLLVFIQIFWFLNITVDSDCVRFVIGRRQHWSLSDDQVWIYSPFGRYNTQTFQSLLNLDTSFMSDWIWNEC